MCVLGEVELGLQARVSWHKLPGLEVWVEGNLPGVSPVSPSHPAQLARSRRFINVCFIFSFFFGRTTWHVGS